jgi:pimeloyl-ACP methyl ester carboxylesterase
MDGTGRLFDRLVACAPAPCRVVAYPHDLLDYDQLAELVASELPDGPYGVIAESFSGPVGITLAAASPPGLVALVLVATFASPPHSRQLAALARAPLFSVAPPRAGLRAVLAGPDADEALVDEVQAAIRSVPAQTFAHRVRQVLTVDVEALLADVTCPITYVQASRDRLVPPAAMERVRAVRPDVRCVEIDAPHLVLQREPQAFWDALAGMSAW